MGTSPIMPVPYALNATNAITGTGTAGKIAAWSNPTELTDVPSVNVIPNVEVVSDPNADDNAPIFEVKNKLGQVVFGVYQEGVRVNVAETSHSSSSTLAGKGGFAIGGLSTIKDDDKSYFIVTPDSVRILLRENQDKAAKGGFAIGGLSTGKETAQDLFFINPDSARIYINTDTSRAAKGGFAIGGLSTMKGEPAQNIFVATADSTRVYVNSSSSLAGKGGFAIGGISTMKDGVVQDIFVATVDSTKIYVSEETGGSGRGRFSVGGRSTTKGGEGKNFFDVNTATTAETIINQNRILWYPQKNAFMTGRLNVLSADQVGENSFASGYESKAKGNYSQALGFKAQALGLNSTAIGNEAKATKDNSFALGEKATAQGVESYAFGREAKATGSRSFAFGSAAPSGSSGGYSWDEAGAPEATGDFSFAIGNGTKAQGKGSIAMGFKSVASNDFAIVIGANDTASGRHSMVIGELSKASGNNSVAMGYYANAVGSSSFAFNRAKALKVNSVALNQSKANAYNALTYGEGIVATSYASIVMGRANDTICTNNTISYYDNITPFSGIGWYDADPLFVVGNGWDHPSVGKRNALTVLKDATTIVGWDVSVNNSSSAPDARYNKSVKQIRDNGYLFYVHGKAGGKTNWAQFSDSRLKTDIKPLQGALQSVLKLQGVTFNWKDETKHRPGQNIGFIAQEVKEVLPEIVSGGGKDEEGNEIYYSIEYATLTPVLVEAIKEQNETIKKLEEKIEMLEKLLKESLK
jgi:hypothetical protein